MGALSSRPVCPPYVEGDVILPVHALDNIQIMRNLTPNLTYRFDSVLDPEKLHSSLSKLLELEGWRKLGGRLRLKSDGTTLEIHVPAKFTPERPAVGFDTTRFDMCISEHPLASQIPRASDLDSVRPSILPPTEVLKPLCSRPGGPVRFDDWLFSDEPQLSIYVVVFRDATLVSMTWPHTAVDGMSRSALMRAWSSVVNTGGTENVPPCLGEREDPLLGVEETDEAKMEAHPLLDKRIGKVGMLRLAVGYLMDIFVWNRNLEARAIFLPRRFVERLKEGCMESVKKSVQAEAEEERNGNGKSSSRDTSTPPSFVSTADVLGALMARLIGLGLLSSNDTSRPFNIWIVTNMRKRVPSLLKAGAVYLGNMVTTTNIIVPRAGELLLSNSSINSKTSGGGGSGNISGSGSGSVVRNLGTVARMIRQGLQEQGSEARMLWSLRETVRHPKNEAPLFGEPSVPAVLNNWSQGGFLSGAVDFSGAIIAGEKEDRKNAGIATYLHVNMYEKTPELRHIVTVYGVDLKGNYWSWGVLGTATWEKVEVELARIGMEVERED